MKTRVRLYMNKRGFVVAKKVYVIKYKKSIRLYKAI